MDWFKWIQDLKGKGVSIDTSNLTIEEANALLLDIRAVQDNEKPETTEPEIVVQG